MKRFSVILSALALVMSMWGCSKGVEPETPDNSVQLRLKGNISAITHSTRVDANGFEADDKVGVYVSATGALTSSGNMLDNTAFTYSSGNLTAPAGKEVYWGTPDVRLSVWAYYPYAESISSNSAYPFAVATNQSEAADYYNSDFITAQATNLAPRAEAVDLTFNHSLSKIAIILKNGTGITSEELASAEKSLSIDGAIIDGTINLADGTATTGTTKATITPYAFDGLNYAAIVYPQQSEITFRIELGDDVYIYSTEVDYAAGTQYKYTFTIDTRNPQGMTLASTTISDWTDDENPTEATLSDIITFTDPKFKEYLLQETLYKVVVGDTPENIGRIDANNDGEISIAEAEKVEWISANELGITDLSELHFFLNLKILECNNNELTTLDVSNNTALTYLWCHYNQLASLDVTNNTALEDLNCCGNQLTTLDVSNNTALENLNCHGNQLTTLDVSNNTALIELYCDTNQLTSLDVSNNTALTFLWCYNNQLTSLDVSKNTALRDLYCYGNQLTTLDVSKNTALTYLNCGGNQLTALDVSNNAALEILYCWENQLTALDMSKNTALERLYCWENQLTSLDVSKNTALTYLNCRENQLTSLDVSNNTALTGLWCHNNQLTTLDVSKNTALEELNCGVNQLTTLDVSNNIGLKRLECSPMDDAEGNNLLETIYTAEGHEFETLEKPEETVIEEKE